MRSLCYYLLSNWDLPRMPEVKIQHFQYLITSNEQLPALEGQIPWPWSLWQHRKYPLEHQHGNGKVNTYKGCFPWTSAHPIASTQMFHLQGLGSGKPGSITPCLLIGRYLKVSCPVAIKVTALHAGYMIVKIVKGSSPNATHILNVFEFIQWQWQQPPLLRHCSYRYRIYIYIYIRNIWVSDF